MKLKEPDQLEQSPSAWRGWRKKGQAKPRKASATSPSKIKAHQEARDQLERAKVQQIALWRLGALS